MIDTEKLKRWRLVLGETTEEAMKNYSKDFFLSEDDLLMDQSLSAIYDPEPEGHGGGTGKRGAGHDSSAPRLAKWLGDVRRFFPTDIVSVIQQDAIERKGLTQLFFEPELLRNVKPDINMVATLVSLSHRIPEKTKETARELIRQVVEEIRRRIENDLHKAVSSALRSREHSPIPDVKSIDWKYTIRRNLRFFNKELGRLVPERFYFFSRQRKANNWTVILDIDQSGSMAESVIYASVVSSIFASMPALDTRVVVFDTEVVDLTEQCKNDPVDMLFGVQLGGGTDINKSVNYCAQFISDPARTIFILISDLYEGGVEKALVNRLSEMKESGVRVIVLLALADSGAPSYDENLARKIGALGIPGFACTPALLPEFFEGALKGHDLMELAKKVREQGRKSGKSV